MGGSVNTRINYLKKKQATPSPHMEQISLNLIQFSPGLVFDPEIPSIT